MQPDDLIGEIGPGVRLSKNDDGTVTVTFGVTLKNPERYNETVTVTVTGECNAEWT